MDRGGEIPHGTNSRYQKHLREKMNGPCLECRAAHAVYTALKRRGVRVPCGTPLGDLQKYLSLHEQENSRKAAS